MNTFENVVNRRVDIPEDIQRFQKTLQYARSKVDYVISEYIYMLPQVNYCRGKILDAYGDIAGHCGRFGAESDWLNFGAPMYRRRA